MQWIILGDPGFIGEHEKQIVRAVVDLDGNKILLFALSEVPDHRDGCTSVYLLSKCPEKPASPTP